MGQFIRTHSFRCSLQSSTIFMEALRVYRMPFLTFAALFRLASVALVFILWVQQVGKRRIPLVVNEMPSHDHQMR